MNIFKTGILMIALTALFMLIGSFFGEGGLMIAFVLAVVMNFGSYWFSDKIVLSMVAKSGTSSISRLIIVGPIGDRVNVPQPGMVVSADFWRMGFISQISSTGLVELRSRSQQKWAAFPGMRTGKTTR